MENKSLLKRITGHQLFIPILAILLLAVINLINDPSFFKITLGSNNDGNPVLRGSLITILDYGSELAILAIGMTLVTAASGGQDISVGATIAIAGSAMLRILCGANQRPDALKAPIIVAFLVACLVGMLCGAFNGALVSIFKIQPMIATLIMFTAGRSIAAWINNNRLPIVPGKTFTYFGGFIPGVPIPTTVFIVILCIIAIALVLKFTNLGLYTQAVGINEKSARLNGINPILIKFIAFVILGLCVAVAALIKVSRLSTINYNIIAKDIEMDAILAVALGGNALSGGKFNMWASILGAYVIQFLTTTLYKFNVESDALAAYKAAVVIILVLFSAPKVREVAGNIFKKIFPRKKKATVALAAADVESEIVEEVNVETQTDAKEDA
ncbi:MAG: ABC transporter permease [Clostridiales bacterium]|nr:ABC transporter permease [Clostridiales bacterium]